MGISRLLARFGFVRIGKYGLILTSDDRILSTRSTVLDDGLGGKIVGWDDADLAAMELERWHPAGAAPLKKGPPPLPRPAQIIALIAPLAPIAPIAPIAPLAPLAPIAPLALIVQAPVIAPIVASAPPAVAPAAAPEEDEWEWEIAVAKARAAADPIPAADSRAPCPPQTTAKTVIPVHAQAMAVGKTVIPVPTLPVVSGGEATRVRPVVTLRAPKAEPPVAPKRLPRATSKHEETIRTFAAPPANDDRTSPSITLPPVPAQASVASSVAPPNGGAVPSGGRRVAARQR